MRALLLLAMSLDQLAALVPALIWTARPLRAPLRAAVRAALGADALGDGDASASPRPLFSLPPAAERSLEAELRVAASVERQRLVDDSAPTQLPNALRQITAGGQLLIGCVYILSRIYISSLSLSLSLHRIHMCQIAQPPHRSTHRIAHNPPPHLARSLFLSNTHTCTPPFLVF